MSVKERNITSEKSYRRAEDDELYQSRAENKIEIAKTLELAGAISLLSKAEIAKMGFSEHLLAAIVTARKISIRTDAYSRHQSYMCKIMRSDGLEPIQAAYDKITNKYNQATVELAKLEMVRDNLIAGGDTAISTLLETYPNADRQKLRLLIRQVNKELKAEKPLKAAKPSKEIFKHLREIAGI
ncbi:ribosome biogenesis factor YjgA [Moritella dasanensis]|jgi:ribosome-associated protein|uniref:ribosome biogenesis factor YjgA n=1 Tax=Moritella dasanensis TaxID=428031 RepID=UPI00031B2254|nr:ribosome biogenesis factor YjgA [Moritella dasanensis]